jgi:hypothetical protein
VTGPRIPQRAATPPIPPSRPAAKDLAETAEPYDLPFPEDHWPPSHPEYVVVVDQLRNRQPGQLSSLAEFLEPGRTRDPGPDLEAEP